MEEFLKLENKKNTIKTLNQRNHGLNLEQLFFIFAANDMLEPLKFLLNSKMNVNLTNSEKWTPLMFAVRNSCMSTAKLLIQHGADIDLENDQGQNVSNIASHFGNFQMLCEFLLKTKKTPEEKEINEALIHLARNGLHKKLCEILDHGFKINTEIKNEILLEAARFGKTEIVIEMLARRISTEVVDHWGQTPLALASANGRVEVVKLLIYAGANVNASDLDGLNPLMKSIIYDHEEIRFLLMENGANVSAARHRAFEIAREKHRPDIIGEMQKYIIRSI